MRAHISKLRYRLTLGHHQYATHTPKKGAVRYEEINIKDNKRDLADEVQLVGLKAMSVLKKMMVTIGLYQKCYPSDKGKITILKLMAKHGLWTSASPK